MTEINHQVMHTFESTSLLYRQCHTCDTFYRSLWAKLLCSQLFHDVLFYLRRKVYI
jgi:hypothetical protein